MSKEMKQKNEYVGEETKEMVLSTLVALGSSPDVVEKYSFDYAAWLLAYIVDRKILLKNRVIEEIKMEK